MQRLLDLILSLLALLLFSPLLVPIGLLLRLTGEGEIFFLQNRIGKDGQIFSLYKFATMIKDSPNLSTGTVTTKNDPRILPIGRFLRKSKINELPQLINILMGDMSMVGPRPLPLRYIPRYNSRQATRLLVHPGLTGWAQIHGRNAVNWPERLELDVRYVEMLGGRTAPLTDLWIVMVTAVQVVATALTGRGVSAQGAATMKEFEA